MKGYFSVQKENTHKKYDLTYDVDIMFCELRIIRFYLRLG